MKEEKKYEQPGDGRLCIKFPWPAIARTIWGNHQRYKETYFSTFANMYFTGDGALRDEVGYYRITGRVDDVIIVSGHNLGTAPIEDAINEHPAVAESAIVGYPHDIKGNALYGFVILKETGEYRDHNNRPQGNQPDDHRTYRPHRQTGKNPVYQRPAKNTVG